jgi:hypothetical protein
VARDLFACRIPEMDTKEKGKCQHVRFVQTEGNATQASPLRITPPSTAKIVTRALSQRLL